MSAWEELRELEAIATDARRVVEQREREARVAAGAVDRANATPLTYVEAVAACERADDPGEREQLQGELAAARDWRGVRQAVLGEQLVGEQVDRARRGGAQRRSTSRGGARAGGPRVHRLGVRPARRRAARGCGRGDRGSAAGARRVPERARLAEAAPSYEVEDGADTPLLAAVFEAAEQYAAAALMFFRLALTPAQAELGLLDADGKAEVDAVPVLVMDRLLTVAIEALQIPARRDALHPELQSEHKRLPNATREALQKAG